MTRVLAGLALGVVLGGCAGGRPAPTPAGPALGTPERRPPAPRPPAGEPSDDVVDRVVAVVNNDAITLVEVQEAIAGYRQETRGRPTVSDDELSRQFLTRLIDTRLQLQEADRERITVEDVEIEEELLERMKRFGATSTAEVEALLKEQGLGMDAVKKRVRESLRISKVIRRKVTLRISVTEAEIDRYLAENRGKLEMGLTYRARHILVTPVGDSDAAWEEARIRTELVREQLTAGADFAELARRHSKDASARVGGDLGTLKRGELAPEIESQILSLGVGETSKPYRSPLGYHLFRLEENEILEGEAVQRARQQVRDILVRQKYEARLEAWLKEIKQRAIIEVRM